ncbi:MAG: winged helix-turn-helix domain-containing protein [Candidatus Nanoarchaeia archaeon]|nr:winged helix-turn-helix domain-containing protein [Candidatus Nanoarchaeia archaeon]
MAKRGKLEIIYDILKIIQKNNNLIKPTPLLRKSNISTMRFKEYFSDLVAKNFVREINHKGEKFISLIDKGFKFLEKYKTIISFIDEFGL